MSHHKVANSAMDDIENLPLNPHALGYAPARPTAVAQQEKKKWKRNMHQSGASRKGDWSDVKETTVYSAKGALYESRRCLKV